MSTFLKVAAVLLLGFIGGVILYSSQVSEEPKKVTNPKNVIKTVETKYGEKKILHLTSGETIILAPGSKITYKEKWLNQASKKVKMEGLAFFSIPPQENKVTQPKFTVLTEDGSASVWGTKFSVSTHGNKTNVVLQEGSVKVDVANQIKKDKPEIFMKPGEKAVFSKSSNLVIKNKVNPHIYTSWISDQLIFDNTELSRLVNHIEQFYGKEVRIIDPTLLDKKISGTIEVSNLNELVEAVSEVLNIQISMSGNDTVIMNHKPNK